MFRLIKKLSRPNVDVPFFHEVYEVPDAYKEHMLENYKGKFLKSMKFLSEDKLVVTQIVEWSCKEDFLEFITDNVCIEHYIMPSQFFESEYGIKTEVSSEEIE